LFVLEKLSKLKRMFKSKNYFDSYIEELIDKNEAVFDRAMRRNLGIEKREEEAEPNRTLPPSIDEPVDDYILPE
jgi:hypothetical protein